MLKILEDLILLARTRKKTPIKDSYTNKLLENSTLIKDKVIEEVNELIEAVDSGKKGRGGHPIISWNITESGRMWRSDLGRFIQLGQRLDFYPESFFYLPSDGF